MKVISGPACQRPRARRGRTDLSQRHSIWLCCEQDRRAGQAVRVCRAPVKSVCNLARPAAAGRPNITADSVDDRRSRHFGIELPIAIVGGNAVSQRVRRAASPIDRSSITPAGAEMPSSAARSCINIGVKHAIFRVKLIELNPMRGADRKSVP